MNKIILAATTITMTLSMVGTVIAFDRNVNSPQWKKGFSLIQVSQRRYSCSVTCSNPNNNFGSQDTKIRFTINASSVNDAYDYVNRNYNKICYDAGLKSKFSGNTDCN